MGQIFLSDPQSWVKILFPSASFLHKSVERWELSFGILFILVVVFFSKGILGTVKDYQNRLRASRREKVSEHSVKAASQFRR